MQGSNFNNRDPIVSDCKCEVLHFNNEFFLSETANQAIATYITNVGLDREKELADAREEQEAQREKELADAKREEQEAQREKELADARERSKKRNARQN